VTKRRLFWAQTSAGREHARRNAQHWQIRRRSAPRCKATAKSTGERCGHPAMNDREVCCWHGGLTPRGDHWLRPRWPKADTPRAEAKLNRKLQDLAKAARKREKRVAAMSPAELERYKAWRAAHQPGSKSKRTAAQEQRRNAIATAEFLSRPAAPVATSPEIAELNRLLDEAKRRAAALELEIAKFDQGIFG